MNEKLSRPQFNQMDTTEKQDVYKRQVLYDLAQSNIAESPEHFTAEIWYVTG